MGGPEGNGESPLPFSFLLSGLRPRLGPLLASVSPAGVEGATPPALGKSMGALPKWTYPPDLPAGAPLPFIFSLRCSCFWGRRLSPVRLCSASLLSGPHQHPGSKEHPPWDPCRPPQMPSLVVAHSCLGSAPLARPQEQAYRRPRGECGEWAFQNPAEDALGDWSSRQDCPRHPVLRGTTAPVGLQPTAPHPPFRV